MVREASLEKCLCLLEQEVASLGKELAELHVYLVVAAEVQRVEVGGLRQFLAQALPDLRECYPSARKSTIQETPARPDETSSGVCPDLEVHARKPRGGEPG